MHRIAATLFGRVLAASLAVLVATMGCVVGGTLAPLGGMPEYGVPGFVPVPGGWVNAAGGNLLLTRTDLSLDTPLGPLDLGAVYNAAWGRWTWSHQLFYDGVHFIDAMGTVHVMGGLSDGAPVSGTHWIRVDADTVQTKGGMAYHFDGLGALEHVRWATFDYPRIEYAATQIRQCTAVAACAVLFAIVPGVEGQPAQITDVRTGRMASFAYDGLGRLVVAKDALANEQGWPGTRYEYSLGGTLLTAQENAEGERIEYDYQASRRIFEVTRIGAGDPTHRFEFFAKEAGLYPTVHTNPLGGETRYAFDGQRRLHRVERPDAVEVETIEWAGLRPSRVVTAAGVPTSFTWTDDVLTTRTDPSGNVVTFTPAPGALNREAPNAPALARIDDSLGPIEERGYDVEGRLVSAANGAGEATLYTYHPSGTLVASRTDPFGVTESFPIYDSHGHWLDLTGPIPDQRAFDLVGNTLVASVVRERGGVLTWAYDPNRAVRTLNLAATDELGKAASMEAVTLARRSDGQPVLVTRPGGGDHQLLYDALGRVVQIQERVDGHWQTTTLEYDAADNLTARTRPNGMREEQVYDVYGRPTLRRALRDGVLEGELALVRQSGRLLAAYDSLRDAIEFYAYDAAGRPTTTLYHYAETLTREYDLRSRLTGEVYAVPGSGIVADIGFAYDAADRRIGITDRLAGEALVSHTWVDGNLVSTVTGNGLTRVRSYEPGTGRLIGFSTTDALGATVETTTVAYTAEVGPTRQQVRTETASTLASTVEEYWLQLGGSLANPDQLVGKRVFGWSDGAAAVETFRYDALGNRTSDSSGNAFAYNGEGNRLLSASFAGGGPTLDYTYDAAGFATSRAGLTITWTATGRMASHGGDTLEWDMRGRLISLTAGGQTRQFALFGGQVESDPQGGTIGSLEIDGVSVQLQSSERRYRHLDFRGNVSFVSDEAGTLTNHYRYGAYGVDAVFGTGDDHRTFVDRAEIGALMILGFRMYDPAVGRFLSQDPIFSLTNQFGYVSGNPVMFSDPDGLDAEANIEIGFSTALAGLAVAGAFLLGGPPGAAAAVAGLSLGLGGLALAWSIAKYFSPRSLLHGPIVVPPSTPSCAPRELARIPDVRRGLLPLLLMQLLLGRLLLRRRLGGRGTCHVGA